MKKIVLTLAVLCLAMIQANAQQTENPQKKMNELINLAFYAKANAELPPAGAGEKRVVFMGNSITYGWVLADKVFFTANNYVGRGISGQTSVQMLLRFRQDVVELNPSAVVVNCGTNDIAENTGAYDPALTMACVKSMSEIAQANGIKVILSSVLPASAFGWNKDITQVAGKVDALNAQIKAYAEANGYAYIDYNSVLRNAEGGLSPEMAKDGIHPTLEAYKIMEKTAKPVIDKVLSQIAE